MSIRALTAEAEVLLNRAATTDREVVKQLCLVKAERLLKRVEVLLAARTELPRAFVDAVIERRAGVIAICPALTRDAFIQTLSADHPARLHEVKTTLTFQGSSQQSSQTVEQ